MNDFDYDVLQRKRLAQQAKYRKNGSKSRKCSLPSDGMTQKQWKERNGEVMTYNLNRLNRPMKWAEFKQLPKDLQVAYISKLRKDYGASTNAIAAMLGVSSCAFRKHMAEKCGMDLTEKQWMTKAQKAAFQEFQIRSTQPQAAPEPMSEPEPEAPELEQPEQQPCSNESDMRIATFTINFDGRYEGYELLRALSGLVKPGQQVSIEIRCTVGKEG